MRAILAEWLGDEASSTEIAAFMRRLNLTTAPARAHGVADGDDADRDDDVPRRPIYPDSDISFMFDRRPNLFS